MMRPVFLLFAAAALPAMAQGSPIAVFFADNPAITDSWMVEAPLHQALARPEFIAATRRDPRLLEVALDGPVARDKGENAKGFNFTLVFRRDGDLLGRSVEYCRSDKLSDCADQIAADIASASSISR